MKIKDLVEELELEVVVEGDLDREVTGCYIGDLLSNVMARAKEGDLWITIQGHSNVIAVALLAEVSAVLIVEKFDIEDQSIQRAEEKGVPLLRTSMTAYEMADKLSQLGI